MLDGPLTEQGEGYHKSISASLLEMFANLIGDFCEGFQFVILILASVHAWVAPSLLILGSNSEVDSRGARRITYPKAVDRSTQRFGSRSSLKSVGNPINVADCSIFSTDGRVFGHDT